MSLSWPRRLRGPALSFSVLQPHQLLCEALEHSRGSPLRASTRQSPGPAMLFSEICLASRSPLGLVGVALSGHWAPAVWRKERCCPHCPPPGSRPQGSRERAVGSNKAEVTQPFYGVAQPQKPPEPASSRGPRWWPWLVQTDSAGGRLGCQGISAIPSVGEGGGGSRAGQWDRQRRRPLAFPAGHCPDGGAWLWNHRPCKRGARS